MRGAWVWGLGSALLAFGAASMAIGARNALRPEQSQDLAPVYKAARLWVARADPYRPVELPVWQAETRASDPPDAPNGPDRSTIYSPIAVRDVALVSAPRWQLTKRLWLALIAAAVWMGGMGLRVGLGNGQHALVWLSLLLTACALAPSWPRTAGVVLAWSMHKFNLTAIIAPYFLAARAFRSVLTAVLVLAGALVVFFAWSQVPAADVIGSYAREFAWLYGQSHGGTLPGHGVTDLYSIIAGVAGDGPIAGLIAFVLAAAGLIVTFYATTRVRQPLRDVDVAAWLLVLLWTTYHRAYDTVLLAVPLSVVIDRAWRAGEWRSWRRAAPIAALAAMWYVDPSKVYLLVHPAALDRIPDAGALVVIETLYRLGVLGAWAYVVSLGLRERGTAGEVLAVQAVPDAPDKTAGVVCAERRHVGLTRVVAEGVTA